MWFLPAVAGVRPGVQIACYTWGMAAAGQAAKGVSAASPPCTAWSGEACVAPHILGEAHLKPPGQNLCPSMAWQTPFCCAGAKCKGACEGGGSSHAQGAPTTGLAVPPSTPCQLQLTHRR